MPRLVAADIARSLKQRIEAGEWPENRVPPERLLAADFGVARNTIRRAMDLLAKDGAVSRHVGRGTFVTPSEDLTLSGVVARMEGVSPADMMEIRALLEPAAAAAAAANASMSELASVEEAHLQAVQASDMPTFEYWDAELHHRIFACSRNQLMQEIHNLLRVLRNQSPWFNMKKRTFSEERRLFYCEQHGALLDALLHRDPDGARKAMEAHLQAVRLNMLGR